MASAEFAVPNVRSAPTDETETPSNTRFRAYVDGAGPCRARMRGKIGDVLRYEGRPPTAAPIFTHADRPGNIRGKWTTTRRTETSTHAASLSSRSRIVAT